MVTFLNIKEYLSYSKKIFFLNFIIFLSIAAAIIGNFALNLVILTSLIFFVVLLIKKEFIITINKTYIVYFIIFKLFFLFNILFSYNSLLSFNSYLGIIKNVLFVLVIYKVFEHNKKNESFFFFSLIILIFFFIFDTLVQFFFTYDLFGYPLQDSHGIRLSGPFGEEFVAGSFLSKILFLVITYIHAGKKNNWVFKYFIILLSNATIFLSGERSAFLITAISSLFFIFFDNRTQIKRKFLVFFFYLIIIFSTLFLNYKIYGESEDKLLFTKYSFLFGYEFQVISEKKNNSNLLIKRENYSLVQNFLDTRHGAHFLTGIEIFLDNKIFGAGLKSFRNICSNSKYDGINSLSAKERCNTHPHNIYIEFISELGIIGFAIILILLLYIFIHILKKKDTPMIAYFFILFFPFQTTGSFFSSFNGFFYYIFFAYFIYRQKFCAIKKF